MSWIHALFLGLIQGAAEFLPVSSSTHLQIYKWIFSVPNSAASTFFDLSTHLGTLFATLFAFRKEVFSLLSKNREKMWLIGLATLPLIPGYIFLKDVRIFLSAPQFLGWMLMATALILFLGVSVQKKEPVKSPWKTPLVVGCAQTLALLPGISRSGSTISAGRMMGWPSKEAVLFSFLLSIPTIGGGLLLESLNLIKQDHAVFEKNLTPCLIGFFASFIIGLFAIRFAISLLSRGVIKPFAWYCLVLGIVLTLWIS